MTEEFNCEDNQCNCGNEHCDCNENTSGKRICNNKESLLCTAVILNTLAVVALTITVCLMAFGYISPAQNGINAGFAQKQGHIFKGKSISYEDAMKSDKPAAILFYADWCRHCQRFGPTYQKLSKDRKLKKKFNFVRINSESAEAHELMAKYAIEGFPTLLLLNPKDEEKYFISNNMLFVENADKLLKEIFLSYAISIQNDSNKAKDSTPEKDENVPAENK